MKQLDLTHCEQEPIRIPGAIQAHGILLALSEPALEIMQLSENSSEVFGRSAQSLIGARLKDLIASPQYDALAEKLLSENLRTVNPLRIHVKSGDTTRTFNGIAHRHHGILILELEPARLEDYNPFFSFYHPAKESILRLREARNLAEICQVAADEVAAITGLDRTTIYKFDEDWNGEVIAEKLNANIDSYFGLHFPASDIPRQARELYTLNWIRHIPDVNYTPSPIFPPENPVTKAPLDLSFSNLRSVSPIHREYLRNMGCSASLSVTLMKEGRLWGLISCTHTRGPLLIPYEVRSICEFLGQIMSSLISVHEQNQYLDMRITTKQTHASLLASMTRQGDFINGLTEDIPNLLHLVGADGAAIYFGGKYSVVGKAPSDEDLAALTRWLAKQTVDDLLVTNSLPNLFPEAEGFKDTACGLIVAPLSRAMANYVMWFRAEVIQVVNWGGDPRKPATVDKGATELHPRRSFELWKESVRGQSLPWRDYEVAAASDLKRSIMDVVLQQSEGLMKLNTELQRSNMELDAFAYAASHDLKEPLRGIHNYANFVLRDKKNVLVPTSRSRLETVTRLSQRLEHMINSLLHYSQVGRVDLSMRKTDLNEVIAQVSDTLRPFIEEQKAKLVLETQLPVVKCDRVKITEVYLNLITNAIKYNDKPEKQVYVGALESGALYVRDNGLGISEEFHETIFKIFRRLHARDKFGGGTGTGLAIAKRIIERHQGKIWLESKPGAGTTFFFTLGGEVGDANQ